MTQNSTHHRSGFRRWLHKFITPSIRIKIVFPYLILTIAIAVVGAYIVTYFVASSLEERLSNHLVEAGRVVSDNLVRQETSHYTAGQGVAASEGVLEALHAGEPAQLLERVQAAAATQPLECLILVDAEGNELLHLLKQPDGAQVPVSTGAAFSDMWIVPAVLNDPNLGPRRAIGLHPVDQHYYYFTAVPIRSNEQLAVVVVVGTRLETLAPLFKSNALADVIFYLAPGPPAVGTLMLDEVLASEDVNAGLTLTPEAYEQLLYNTETTIGANLRIYGRWYRLGRGPLRVGNDTIGVFGVLLPSEFIISAGTDSRNTYVGLLALVTVAVVILGYLISQRLTAPLAQLAYTARVIADGRLDQRTGIRSGDEIGVLATTFDQMTGRLEERTHELEQLLHVYKEASGRMRAILLSIGDGVILEDLQGNFTPLNPAAETMLQQMSAGFRAEGLRERIATLARLSAHNPATPWIEDPRRFEVGQQVFDIHSAPVHTDEGRNLGKVIVLRDVTAEVEAERLKDAFVTHVSHELRTPLTVIKGYTSLLLRQAVGGVALQMRGFFETIDRNTDDLIAMVEELLEMSEIEARGGSVVRPQPDTLVPLIEEIAARWKEPMLEKNLNFQVDLRPDLPLANLDVRRLRRAVMALLRNAWQYTPEGGDVTVRVDALDRRLRVHISDTGSGIAPEDLKHLFARFHRFTGEAFDNVRGLGLGLYITRAIVEAHGGDIEVVSEVDVGSTFTINLPTLPGGAPGGGDG